VLTSPAILPKDGGIIFAMVGLIEARLIELGIELPDAVAPVANYVPYVISGNLVFVSGQIPLAGGAMQLPGRIGEDLSVEDGQKAATICALASKLSSMKRYSCCTNSSPSKRMAGVRRKTSAH